jgi:hypothetical protein
MRLSLALAAVLVCGLAACNRNIEPYVPGEQPREPDLARIFPDGGESPGASLSGPQSGVTPPSIRPGQLADTRPAADGSAEAIHGSIELAPDLAGYVPPGATLFLIARPVGVTRGPPLAVRRFGNPSLPLEFEIGPQHAMVQGIPFAGEIQLSVRLDGDGDAMTRRPGDLSGSAQAPVEPGTRGVRIVLDQRN